MVKSNIKLTEDQKNIIEELNDVFIGNYESSKGGGCIFSGLFSGCDEQFGTAKEGMTGVETAAWVFKTHNEIINKLKNTDEELFKDLRLVSEVPEDWEGESLYDLDITVDLAEETGAWNDKVDADTNVMTFFHNIKTLIKIGIDVNDLYPYNWIIPTDEVTNTQ